MLRRTWVAALYSLQNPMMLTPAAPRAGPTGGEGLALPAGRASLMIFDTARGKRGVVNTEISR